MPQDALLLLFDIDGTLLKPVQAHGQALRGAIEQVYCIAAHAAGYRYAGATDCMIIADIARMQGVPAETIEAGLERCTEIANQAFAACLPTLSIEPLPGVTQTLQRLRAAGHRLGRVTGPLEPIAHGKLRLAAWITSSLSGATAAITGNAPKWFASRSPGPPRWAGPRRRAARS